MGTKWGLWGQPEDDRDDMGMTWDILKVIPDVVSEVIHKAIPIISMNSCKTLQFSCHPHIISPGSDQAIPSEILSESYFHLLSIIEVIWHFK